MTTAVAVFTMGVGTLMVAWWILSVRGGALGRPDRSQAEIRLHLIAELVTALALIVGGIVLLTGTSRAPVVAAAGLGMLLYTLIASPGYFLARGERGPVVLFAALAVATFIALGVLLSRPT